VPQAGDPDFVGPVRPAQPGEPDFVGPVRPPEAADVAKPGIPAKGSLTDIQARDWYHAKLAEIDKVEQEMRAQGKSTKEIYETTSPMRNEAKQTARDLMQNRGVAESLPPIKSPEYYLEKYGGDYEKALEAVKRSNAEVDREIEARRAAGEK
jgi:hypothetical protein